VIANAGARHGIGTSTTGESLPIPSRARGRIIDSELDVGGYPVQLASHQAFQPADWDMRYMTPKVAPKYNATH